VDSEIDQVVLPLLGLAHFKLGEYGLAARVMERALTLFDESPSTDQDQSRAETLLNLGCAYVKLGQCDKAVEILTRVLEQNPRNAFAYYERARAYGRIGDADRCVQSLQSAIDHDRKFLKRIAVEDDFATVRGSDSFLELVAKNTRHKRLGRF
jgi:tetratricopeptide (TPR) repeat protein